MSSSEAEKVPTRAVEAGKRIAHMGTEGHWALEPTDVCLGGDTAEAGKVTMCLLDVRTDSHSHKILLQACIKPGEKRLFKVKMWEVWLGSLLALGIFHLHSKASRLPYPLSRAEVEP